MLGKNQRQKNLKKKKKKGVLTLIPLNNCSYIGYDKPSQI